MEPSHHSFRDRVLDLAVNGIYVYDLVKGTNVYINQQYTNLTGYTLEDINAMNPAEFFALFHPDDQDQISQHMEAVRQADLGEIFEVEYRFRKADGSWMWCLSRDGVFDQNANRDTTQFMGSFIDITDRKQFETELQQANRKLVAANKELEQFAYIASHDLQEPLRTVGSFADLLEQEYAHKLAPTAGKYLHFLTEASSRMSQLVKGLLDYSRIGRRPEKEETDCNLLVAEVLADFEIIIQETRAVVTVADLPTLQAHPVELRLLLQNLISNAIKFHKPGQPPQVQVSARRDGPCWEFSVSDQGIGIPAEYHERIFSIFRRLHDQKTYQGTGIGLSHCQKIVNLHGGEIWVESAPDQGSTFYFTIPTDFL